MRSIQLRYENPIFELIAEQKEKLKKNMKLKKLSWERFFFIITTKWKSKLMSKL